MTTDTFRGRLGEQTYTDPALFALDVEAQGTASQRRAYVLASGRLDMGRTPAQLTVLTAVEKEWLGCWVRTPDGREGQVWSLGWARNAIAVVLDGAAETFAAGDLTHTATCSDGSRIIGDPLEGL